MLERDDLKDIVARFREADSKAVAAQRRYKRAGRLGLYAATLATVTGAVFLLPIETWLQGIPATAASGVQIAALAIAFLASRYVVVAKPFDAWMKHRAEAENARVALFGAVIDARESAGPGEAPYLPLALEYFRRYQLDVQRRYYKGRATQHEAASWRNNQWLRASLVLTTVSVILGLMLALQLAANAGVAIPSWLLIIPSGLAQSGLNRISLALGVVASSFYGLGAARSLMDLDERNASRYSTTSQNLEYLFETRLDPARAAAIEGSGDDVGRFVDDVHNQISTEHREWILLSARPTRPDRLRHAGAGA